MNEFPADFLGNEIAVGCTVIYPVRQGSNMWLRKVKITQVIKAGDVYRLKAYDPDSAMKRTLTIQNLNTCVVVSQA